MQLIITPAKLEQEFKRLIGQYKSYYWATAWAGVPSKLLKELAAKQTRIEKIIVGLHFYQTHPDFIGTFIKNEGVRFIKQPSGTFHPKVYLFYNSDTKWELLVGSANFTNEAFSRNTEATSLISSKDNDADKILMDVLNMIEQSWLNGAKFTASELVDYRIAWKNQKPKRDSLSGLYGGSAGKRISKPIYKVAIANYSWEVFVNKVKQEGITNAKGRLRVLLICNKLFSKVKSFRQLTEDERKFIAGIPNKLEIAESVDSGWFGRMKGSGIFMNKINANDINISRALDQIPLDGAITQDQYEAFISHYRKTFDGDYIATSTRLLAMKRPDTFICLDSKNESKLCKAFGIKQSGMTYERYWTDIIERIFDFDWYKNPKPNGVIERQISDSRAAFLDALYYDRD